MAGTEPGAGSTEVDAVVVGAGPNGLTAAVTLARAGLSVRVYEAAATVGGGARTGELTLPGFRHDICSAVHPLGAGSPAFAALPLDRYGLTWVEPPLPLAHPFPDGSAATLARSAEETAASLGGDTRDGDADGDAYLRLVRPFLGRWSDLAPDVLRAPLDGLPRHPVRLARFGFRAVAPAALLARLFRGERARGLLAGLAAHAIAPLGSPATGGVALLFALAAHDVGWPFPRGGSQALSDALAAYLRALGGRIETGRPVGSLAELPAARAYLLDVMPEDLAALAGDRLPERYAARLRGYRHGPAVFKIDYALSEPVPWKADACARAGTVHLGPTFGEIGAALRAACRGSAPRTPFLIAAQPSLFDGTRAPDARHVLWVYGHVPNGWRGDLTEAIERQIERFAPGFRDRVLARAAAGPAEIEARDRNNTGGDIAGGRCDRLRLLFRPILARVPYATPDRAVYLCSSATPPGPGVHGMCGYHAARTALRRVFGLAPVGEWGSWTGSRTGSRRRTTG
ncbi:NAD(P)/FAD-dependent oxidoreductase [Microtetraspora sp. NBRC 16547]|uniref:phytoene desaturase family protein n=1 Tax=Microtetraspora sp. NBRC 16547 TaxID=3030993 RepID=UPI0024A45EB3|nr:NAD(P)/FAD-dependent oxidoreductase [Microtetraspora sp. NBRC 16547]GLW99138.1 dehydrogenase [Microtetraspora sp. NBRC 16547]